VRYVSASIVVSTAVPPPLRRRDLHGRHPSSSQRRSAKSKMGCFGRTVTCLLTRGASRRLLMSTGDACSLHRGQSVYVTRRMKTISLPLFIRIR